MGTHAETDEHLDPETKAYNDLINTGNDYVKIQLYAYAIKKYKQALLVKPYDKYANAQIYMCKAKFRKDNMILAAIALVAVIAVSLVIFLK